MAVLARVERTDFLSPMCIGEVAHVSAEITYTSKHSVEVQVHVMSENILTGDRALPARWVEGRCSGAGPGSPHKVSSCSYRGHGTACVSSEPKV